MSEAASVFRPANPFLTSMTKLKMPDGVDLGGSVSIEGFEMFPDTDGCVEVPKNIAQRLVDHGLEYVDHMPPLKAPPAKLKPK